MSLLALSTNENSIPLSLNEDVLQSLVVYMCETSQKEGGVKDHTRSVTIFITTRENDFKVPVLPLAGKECHSRM